MTFPPLANLWRKLFANGSRQEASQPREVPGPTQHPSRPRGLDLLRPHAMLRGGVVVRPPGLQDQ
jgi:hypothetical protein